MHIYYITGTSRGIGKALAEEALREEQVKVIGMSRSCSIEHDRYEHIGIDLADPKAVLEFGFGKHPEAERVVLINNAGTLGDIKPVGKEDDEAIFQAYDLNLGTPSVLSNKFAATYEDRDMEKVIVNVSSGAGKTPIDGWNTYCASKAALDMFSRVMAQEQKLHQEHPIKVLSVAPGVVDTRMQTDIRASKEADFSTVQKFRNLKEQGELADPGLVARKYFHILRNLEDFPNVEYSVRDL